MRFSGGHEILLVPDCTGMFVFDSHSAFQRPSHIGNDGSRRVGEVYRDLFSFREGTKSRQCWEVVSWLLDG